MKYRAGHGEERMTPLSVEYCRRVRTHLAAIGSPIGRGEDVLIGTASASTNAPETASSAEAGRAAKLSPSSPPRQTKSVALGTKVLPPQRRVKGSRVAAEKRSLALAQEKEKRRKTIIRQMWAAHNARMQSISAKLRPESLRIAIGI
jgi:flagellar hook-length control protein FliK